MLCLGIESSCDDTGAALVEDGRLRGSVLASQARLHGLFGGVVPELASREHQRFLGPLFDELLRISGAAAQDIDFICAARGPGLLGSLLVGASFAKGLALGLGRPLICVNHLHAHLLVCGLEAAPPYPFIGLLASGGHTSLYRVESPTRFILLGKCLDDAAGEIFDKVGAFLGLPYPAGAAIDDLAQEAAGDQGAIALPRPYLQNDNLDFSFSGLKTAALQHLKSAGEGPGRRAEDAKDAQDAQDDGEGARRRRLADFCAAFNDAAAGALAEKTARALRRFPDVRSLVLAGGVAANRTLRRRLAKLAEEFSLPFFCPPPALCVDNGAMIAYAGYLLAKEGARHSLETDAIPRGAKMPDDLAPPA